ncbi:MAG: hypothetical protein DRN25_04145 [Thermoplasmata archaeon]|nr:MAG: hypothetical protein DRN25_04145 [Thermoplasmata archaeon]
MDTSVSVIIPAYNEERFIAQAIESVLNQTHRVDEIIVIDDGSTDKTAEIAKSYDVIYCKNEKNLGIGATRALGTTLAKGRYISFLSADDCYCPEYVETMLTHVENKKILYSSYYICDENLGVVGIFSPPKFSSHEAFCIAAWNWAEKNSMFVNFSTTFFPREIFKVVNFDPALRFGEDLDFLLRSMKFFEYKLIDKPLLKYRAYQGNETSLRIKEIPENNKRIIENAKRFWNLSC